MRLTRTLSRRLPAALALAALSLAPATALRAQALPAADELVARHVKASGGESTIRKYESTRVVGRLEMPSAGLQGEMTMLSAAPDRSYMKVVLPGLGEIHSGYTGTHAWSVNPMQGARLAEGKELEFQAEEADYYGMLRDQPGVTSRTTVERAEMGGVPCYKVKVSWKSGRESFECYSTETGLLAGTQARIETPQGTVDVTSLMSDYKEFGGVNVPTVMRQQIMGMEQIIRIDSVQFNAVQPGDLEPPAAIQTLLKEKGGA